MLLMLKLFKNFGRVQVTERLHRKSGKTYDEKSLSVEIIDIPFEMLVAVAESIAKEFNQKEVLVKSYDNGRIILVDRN